MKKKLTALVLACTMVLGAVAGIAASSTAGKYTSISFNTSSIVLQRGASYTLNVSSAPTNDVKTTDLIWSSDDTRVVTVSDRGEIKAKNLYGGAIVTASTQDGVKAVCYVGVGSPYGYNNGYYSGYYPGDYYYPSSYYTDYNYPNYYTNYNYPNYYYGNGYKLIQPTYDYDYYYGPNYSYYSPYYNDYYYNGYYDNYYPYPYSCYVNRSGKVVYSVDSGNTGTSYVTPGSSTTAAMFALETQQGVTTTYDGSSVGFAFVNNSNAMVITPEKTGDKTNSLTLKSGLLDRFNRFGFKTVKYRLPSFEVSIHPDFVASGAATINVAKVKDTSVQNVVSGPWSVTGNSKNQDLSFRFILDKEYNRNDLKLMMRDENDGVYLQVKDDYWKLMRSSVGDSYTYYVETEKVAPGTYVLVTK